MSSANTSSLLPIDVINHITKMASIQQDKMYVPVFSPQNGKLNWKFNAKSTKMKKLEELYFNLPRNVYFGRVKIQNIVYECKTRVFYDAKGNKTEYVDVENHINALSMSMYLKYTSVGDCDFQMFFTGFIYDIGRLEYGEHAYEMLRIQIIDYINVDRQGIYCYAVDMNNGSWIYNHNLHILEYVINATDELDWNDDGVQHAEVGTGEQFFPEWAQTEEWMNLMMALNPELMG